MIVIGISSGTSVDAIDAAAADLDLRPDGSLHLRPLGHTEYPWPEPLRRRILAALPPAAVDMGEVCELDTLVGQELGAAARRAVDDLAGGDADLVASHGQTLHHWVVGNRTRGTLQLGNPAWVAERARRPVVSDFRVADVAAGGQGAPLVSVLDALWLGSAPDDPGGISRTAALNIGGIANVSVVGRHGDPVVAWDTGPGNCLVDGAVQRMSGGREPFDRDGRIAASGTVEQAALKALLDEPFYDQAPPRSTGRELFDGGYAAARFAAHGIAISDLDAADLVATLVELTALTIARSLAEHVPEGVDRVVVSGGGARNPVLLDRLRSHLPDRTSLVVSDELGLPSDAKEAYLFALLGYLGAHGIAGTAPGQHRRRATGARRAVVLGSLTPPTPLELPAAGAQVRRLVLANSPHALTSPRVSRP